MAEFCLSCWNKLNHSSAPASKFIFSTELDLCEGCGKWTNVIVMERKQKLRTLIFPLRKNRSEK